MVSLNVITFPLLQASSLLYPFTPLFKAVFVITGTVPSALYRSASGTPR